MFKAQARTQAKAQRQALTPEQLEAANSALTQQWTQLDLRSYQHLMVYVPMPERREPDTWRLLPGLWAQGKQIYTSVTHWEARQLELVPWEPTTTFTPNAWGIPEPASDPNLSPLLLDAVVVPLLACDIHGQRVGYGQGFYDRFLAQCRPDIFKIGLSFFEPHPPFDDVLPTDIPLDVLVTPERIVTFS